MNPLSAALISGTIVVAGKWANKKTPNIDNAVGIAGIAIGLALLDQASEKLATAFAWLIVLTVSIVYVPQIVKAAGLA